MIIILAADNTNGSLFYNDSIWMNKELRGKIAEISKGFVLMMNEHSSGHFFDDLPQNTLVDERFLEIAGVGEYCFVENVELKPYADKTEAAYLFLKNDPYCVFLKNDYYSYCNKLDFFPWEEEMHMTYKQDFKLFLHENITMQVWERKSEVISKQKRSHVIPKKKIHISMTDETEFHISAFESIKHSEISDKRVRVKGDAAWKHRGLNYSVRYQLYCATQNDYEYSSRYLHFKWGQSPDLYQSYRVDIEIIIPRRELVRKDGDYIFKCLVHGDGNITGTIICSAVDPKKIIEHGTSYFNYEEYLERVNQRDRWNIEHPKQGGGCDNCRSK